MAQPADLDQKMDDLAQEAKKKKRTRTEPRMQSYKIKGEKFTVFEYYEPQRILGHGAYAVVCEALDTRSRKKVAIKKNRQVFQELSDAKRILREIKLLIHLNHPDIIKLIDVIPPTEGPDGFEDVYLVMDCMETTLARVIKSGQTLTDRHFQFFVYQMLRGLKYMHSAGVIHRDIKPENILINGTDCNVKITDFGLARGVHKDDHNLTEYVVTRWYRAPEVMVSARQYTEKVDVWSVGCIFAELLLGKPMFPGGNHIEQLKIIFTVLGKPTEGKDDWIKSPEAKRWVRNMKDMPGKDLSLIFQNATTLALDLLTKMLKTDPDDRISVDDALAHQYLEDLHRPEDEITAKEVFNIDFEYESRINTPFGIRHMMHEELVKYHKKVVQESGFDYQQWKKERRAAKQTKQKAQTPAR